MSNIVTNIGRELTTEEIEMVAGGSVHEGIRDIKEGLHDIAHGHIGEGIGDIVEGIGDIIHAHHRRP